MATGDETYIGAAVETIEGVRLIKEALPRCSDPARHLQRLLRPAAGGARGAQLGLPLPRDPGRARPRDRQHRAARALRLDPRGRAGGGRGPAPQPAAARRSRSTTASASCLLGAPADWRQQNLGAAAWRSTNSTSSRLTERYRGASTARRSTRSELPLDERLARAVVEGSREGLVEDLRAALDRGDGAARRHQRPADGRHGRGRAAVRRQPADRRRGAAVGRGDEGGGELPRAAHGRGRDLPPGHHRARHRQGGRPRHRQEPGRDHPRQQRLRGRQPRHQGAARGDHRGGSGAPPGRHRPVRPAGQVGPADGGDRRGPARGRHRAAPAGRRRRAVPRVSPAADRPGLRGAGRLLQRRHAGPRRP